MYKLTQQAQKQFKTDLKKWWGEEQTQYQADICDYLNKSYLIYLDFFVRQAILNVIDSLKNEYGETENFEIYDISKIFNEKLETLLKLDEKLTSLSKNIKINSSPIKDAFKEFDTENIEQWSPDVACEIICNFANVLIKKNENDSLDENDWQIFYGILIELQKKCDPTKLSSALFKYTLDQMLLLKYIGAINSKQALIMNVYKAYTCKSVRNDSIFLRYLINFYSIVDIIFEIDFNSNENIELLTAYKKIRDRIVTLDEATFVKSIVDSRFEDNDQFEKLIISYQRYKYEKPDVIRCIKSWIPYFELIQDFQSTWLLDIFNKSK